MTPKQINYLCNLYDAQRLTVDKLGGTTELTLMQLKLRTEMGVKLTEGELLTQLINLRKSGMLNTKAVREPKPKPKPTFKKLIISEAGFRYYGVPIVVAIGRYQIMNLINKMEMKPVTRQEVYDFLQQHPEFGIASEGWRDDISDDEYEEISKRTEQLFPELNGS